MTITLIIGGARSGKSRRAQSLAEAAGPQRIYIATAEPIDKEMRARITRHQTERGAGWRTLNAPLNLPEAIARCAPHDIVLVDCLTLWLNNLFFHKSDIEAQTKALIKAIGGAQAQLFLVSNELGMGLVPQTPLGRDFRDAQGRLNQAAAQVCNRVEFIAAGLPLILKG